VSELSQISNLNQKQINSISRQVYRKFPELDGATPKVKSQSVSNRISGLGSRSKHLEDQRFLLTYKGTASIPGGRTMMRVVRAVANAQGKLLKISSSK